ncbi:hypothetical protein JTE90_020525 [Oedothorax gibbosus]|uniref:Uncharacterized protein n=1 Tax=Oedothorax gibbosus TaxID=931172 RepID=A0AAV6VXS6_9ARAC|nr:hypothetical protein JTE90_020525 [Oedothorax gibbosus]
MYLLNDIPRCSSVCKGFFSNKFDTSVCPACGLEEARKCVPSIFIDLGSKYFLLDWGKKKPDVPLGWNAERFYHKGVAFSSKVVGIYFVFFI